MSDNSGFCLCGCGHPTPLARRSRKDRAAIKGRPIRYIVGHNSRWRGGPPLQEGEGWCGRCKTIKPRSDFFTSRKNRSGIQGTCKPCNQQITSIYRAANRAKIFEHDRRSLLKQKGMTAADYQALLDKQGGCCAICQEPEKTIVRGTLRLLPIDHDHATGKVRGLLCTNCNRALGLFRDSHELLLRAVAYLQETTPQ